MGRKVVTHNSKSDLSLILLLTYTKYSIRLDLWIGNIYQFSYSQLIFSRFVQYTLWKWVILYVSWNSTFYKLPFLKVLCPLEMKMKKTENVHVCQLNFVNGARIYWKVPLTSQKVAKIGRKECPLFVIEFAKSKVKKYIAAIKKHQTNNFWPN